MNRKFSVVVSWGMLVFWMVVIFGFSSQDGDASNGLSSVVAESLARIINIEANSGDAMYDLLTFLIRKAAHFTEYAVLAILWCFALSHYEKLKNKGWIIALLASAAYAVLDEFHQSFVGGRTPALRDVIIDTCGALFGILVFDFIIWVRNKIKNNIEADDDSPPVK